MNTGHKFSMGIIVILLTYMGLLFYQGEIERKEEEAFQALVDSLNCSSHVIEEVKILMDSFKYEDYPPNILVYDQFLKTTSLIYAEMMKNSPDIGEIIRYNNRNQELLKDVGILRLRDSLMKSDALSNNYINLYNYLNTVQEIDSLCNHYVNSPESRSGITDRFFDLRNILISLRCK